MAGRLRLDRPTDPANFRRIDGDWEGIPTTDESYGWNKFDTSKAAVAFHSIGCEAARAAEIF